MRTLREACQKPLKHSSPSSQPRICTTIGARRTITCCLLKAESNGVQLLSRFKRWTARSHACSNRVITGRRFQPWPVCVRSGKKSRIHLRRHTPSVEFRNGYGSPCIDLIILSTFLSESAEIVSDGFTPSAEGISEPSAPHSPGCPPPCPVKTRPNSSTAPCK